MSEAANHKNIFVIARLRDSLNAIVFKNGKMQKRAIDILLYALNNIAAPVFSIVLSFILIKRISLSFWGEFAALSLIANTCVMILGWGNKEFLLKEFSKYPAAIHTNWQANFASRFFISCILSLVIFIWFDYSVIRFLAMLVFIISAFVYKSMDVLILYKRAFSFSAVLEILGYAVLIGVFGIYPMHMLTVETLFLWIAGITIIKCFVCFWYLRAELFPVMLLPGFFSRKNSLLVSLPFFLPSLAGIIQTKTDLFCVAYFLSPDRVGAYQIYMNLLNIPHILAGFIIMPFLKNLYRLPMVSIRRVVRMITLSGVLFSALTIVCIYVIIEYYYAISFSFPMYVLGYLQIIPFFIYLIKIHMLFRFEKQHTVLWIISGTGLFSFILSMLVIPVWGLEGAIATNMLTQWLALLLFEYVN